MSRAPATWEGSARRRDAAYRVLPWGAAAGFIACVAAVLVFGGDGTQDRIVRAALVAPVVIYVLWWVAYPGFSTSDEPVGEPREVDEIASVFDTAEDYRAARPRRQSSDREFRGRLRHDETVSSQDLRPRFRRDADSAAN